MTTSSVGGAGNAPSWEQRFRAARLTLPRSAPGNPVRSSYVSNETGVSEVYAWDRASGDRHRVTDRPNGTSNAYLDFSGDWVWWFNDKDGDELGTWVRQPFAGGADEPAAPGVAKGYDGGLAFSATGDVVVGRSDEAGSTITLIMADGVARTVYENPEHADVAGISRDGELVAFSHGEHGDSRRPAVRVVDRHGALVAELWDGPGKGLHPVDFAPAGPARLLVLHERSGSLRPLVWDPVSGHVTEIEVEGEGEVRAAHWFADGQAILLLLESAGRSRLARHDLQTEEQSPIEIDRGYVSDARPRPDGTVEMSWSSAEAPWQIRTAAGATVLTAEGAAAPRSVPVQDVWVDGPGGRVRALLHLPEGASLPCPTVVQVHGGPTWADRDEFAPMVAAWVDHGFAVVRVNYRGSLGYGTAWRDALEADIGHIELADVAAVRDHLVSEGIVDPARLVLAGGSWGGFLTLLGLGVQPDAWTIGVAWVPVADYLAAYEDEAEPLKAYDRSLFGGSPQDVPERYRRASPITYVEAVRAPVILIAGENDSRCPIRQIDNYLARLDALGRVHDVYRFEAGHGSLVVDEQIRQFAVGLDFVQKHLT
jgi:dienelactone hydrolase